jgi:hypothetical protein
VRRLLATSPRSRRLSAGVLVRVSRAGRGRGGQGLGVAMGVALPRELELLLGKGVHALPERARRVGALGEAAVVVGQAELERLVGRRAARAREHLVGDTRVGGRGGQRRGHDERWPQTEYGPAAR